MQRVRVVLFGQGFARTTVLPCLRQVPGAEVVGIASPSLDRLRETAAQFDIPAVASDHREILERTRPDVAIVASPPHRHAEMALDALDAGCHVLCEKPMALDAGETARMVDAARARPGRLALLDHELRFLPARERLAALAHGGALGELRRAEYILRAPSRRDPAYPWSWWSDRSAGGGVLGAIGSHAIDALRHLLGEVAEARGWLETLVAQRPDPAGGAARPVTADDHAACWLRFASGAVASITLSVTEAERCHSLVLNGTDGWARLDEQGPLLIARGGGRPEREPVPDDLPSSGELGIPDTDWARAFLRFARLIVQAVRAGTPLDGAATFEDGHRAQQVMDAVRRSSADGGWEPVPARDDGNRPPPRP